MKLKSIILTFFTIIIYCKGQNYISGDEWKNTCLIISKTTGAHIYDEINSTPSQNPYDIDEDIFNFQWQQTYSNNILDHGRYAQKAIDNGYIMAGRTLIQGEDDNNFDGWIIKTDDLGNVIWDKTYGDYYVDELEVIKKTSDNAYLAIGTSTMFGNSGEGWMLKLDENGEIIWNKGFHSPLSTNWDYLFDFTELEDQTYVCVGFSTSFTQGWIIKVDQYGNEIWNHEYGDNSYWERLFSIAPTDDGGFLAVGDKHVEYENVISPDGWVVKFDSLGNILWQKTYGNERVNIFRTINNNPDGTFTILGEQKNQNEIWESWILKIDSEGNTIYEGTLGNGEPVSSYYLEDNKEVICVNKSNMASLMLIDSQGNTLNQQFIDNSEGDDRITSMQITGDGEVILGGRANATIDTGNFWLVSLEKNPLITSEWTQNKSILYPNPSQNFFNIKSEEVIYNIEIINSSAEIVFSKNNIYKKNVSINISKLLSGIYWVRIFSKNKIETIKLIVN